MYSNIYNTDSFDTLQSMMSMKNCEEPYFVNGKDIKLMITDMDHFPYRRYFRVVYDDPKPIIHSRYAGYRPYLEFGCNLKCNNCDTCNN